MATALGATPSSWKEIDRCAFQRFSVLARNKEIEA
jgi:hypothetical protein